MQKKELISFKSGLFELILPHEVTIDLTFGSYKNNTTVLTGTSTFISTTAITP